MSEQEFNEWADVGEAVTECLLVAEKLKELPFNAWEYRSETCYTSRHVQGVFIREEQVFNALDAFEKSNEFFGRMKQLNGANFILCTANNK